MYGNIFQLIKEVFLVAVWFVFGRIKMACVDFYEYLREVVFHRRHKFLAPDLWINEGDARCTKCRKRLKDVSGGFKFFGPAFLFLIFTIARADNFVAITPDSVFFHDSVYVLKVAVTQSTCDTKNPCTLQIASEGGSGTVFKNLYGNGGDTISVPYSFPASQFASGASRVTIYFFGSDGKAKDIVASRLGYKDPNPNALRRPVMRLGAAGRKWNGLVNGRIFR